MSTPLSTTTTGSSGPPTVIIDQVGAKFRGAVVDIEPRQETEYLDQAKRDAGRIARPMWWENRMPTPLDPDAARARGLDPVMYDVITYLTLKASDGVTVGDDEAVEAGTIVTLHAHGPRGRGWRDAVKGMGRGPVVGDIHLISFDAEDADTRAKTITFTIEATDPAVTAQAEEARAAKLAAAATPVPTSNATAPAPVAADVDDPF